MNTYTIGYTGTTSGATGSRGQTFTPNVAGTGSGIPAGTSTVYLLQITVAYNSSDTSGRANMLYLYSSKPSMTDLNNGGTGSMAASTGYADGSAFGTGTYTRTYTFNSIDLDAATKYFFLFSQNQTLRYATVTTGGPYSGGEFYNTSLNVVTNFDVQFEVTVSV